MTREFRRLFLDFRIFVFLVLPGFGVAMAQEIPAAILGSLSAEKFSDREAAQAELADWSRKQPARAIRALYKQSENAPDPETRVRCHTILRQMVIEHEFPGEGYLGISMNEIGVQVPGEKEARQGIRIGMVMPGTAAETAGLAPNDLIVGLGQQIWRQWGMRDDFSRLIRETPPGKEVLLHLLKGEKIVAKTVKLGIKPEEEGEEGRFAAKRAQERFFQRWLDNQVAGGR